MSEKITSFIQSEYEKRKEKNPRYSMRAYANALNIEHSTLSKILAQKRPLTFETANKILSALDIQTSIKNSLLLTLSDPSSYEGKREDSEYVTLTEEELEKTYRWYFFAILSALEIPTIKPTSEGLAEFLELDSQVTQSSVSLLIKMGAIQKNKNNELELTGKCYTTTNEVKSSALVRAHVDHMEQAIRYIESSKKQSDYSGMTVAIPIEKLSEAKRRIKEFRRSFGSWLSEDSFPKTDVYRFNLQFFPLSKNRDK